MENVAELNELVECLPLPDENCSLLAAYGSGAIQQRAERIADNVVDYIVAVDDALRFHADNLARNPSHYSFVGWLGAGWNARLQTQTAARVYFNTLVRVPPAGRLIKYGVVQRDHLVADLLDWDYLYMSGRLHKPHVLLRGPKTDELANAMASNLQSAVHAALILLPETFSREQLFHRIASVSYDGDVRQRFGENRNKVSNIVKANLHLFDDMYGATICKLDRLQRSGERFEQDVSPAALYHHLNMLPRAVLWRLQDDWWLRTRRHRDLEEVTFAAAHDDECAERVAAALAAVVRRSSVRQSAKNAATAGLRKSIAYSWRKLRKMIRSAK